MKRLLLILALFCPQAYAVTAGALSFVSTGSTTAGATSAVATGGTGPYTYQWKRSTTSGSGYSNVGGQTTLTLSDSGLSSTTNYYYVVVATDSLSATGQSAQLQIATQPALLTTAKICGIGDSISNGGSNQGSLSPLTQLTTDLNANPNYAAATLYNRAVSGTTTADWLPGGANMTNVLSDIQLNGINTCNILLGTNDSKIAVATSQATYLANINSMISTLQAAGVQRIFVSAVGFIDITTATTTGIWDAASLTLILQYNTSVASLDNGTTIRSEAPGWYTISAAYPATMLWYNGSGNSGLHLSTIGATYLGDYWARAYNNAVAPGTWSKIYKITIASAQAGTADSTGFTVLVNITSDANLKTASNGGVIQNTVTYNGQTVPADLGVFSDSGCSTPVIGWDEAFYEGTSTGKLELWFGPVTLSHTVDGVYYLCFGDSTQKVYQGGAVGAAYSAAGGLYHLSDGTTLSGNDSSGNTYTGTITSVTAGAGQIDGAGVFGTSKKIVSGVTGLDLSTGANWTMSAWVEPGFASSVNTGNAVISYDSGGSARSYLRWEGTSLGWYVDVLGQSTGSAWDCHTAIPSFSANTWHRLDFTHTSSNVGVFYWDGSPLATTRSVTSTETVTAQTIALGYGEVNSYYWNGSLDQTEVWTGVLSASWITAAYNMEKSSQTMVTLQAIGSGPRGAQVAELAGPKLRGLH